MRVCPTNGLQPVWLDAGLEGLWSPELAPRIGYCEFNCNLCGEVCPSGAIKLLDEAAKHRTIIGIAAIDHDRCIPWVRAQDCLVCEEHCPTPTKAIRLRPEIVMDDSGAEVEIKKPYVVEAECIGCGICETRCPVSGASAIRVIGIMPQKLKAAAAVPGAAGIGRVFPAAVGAWKAAGPPRIFEQDKLYDFINGGAEVYYEYGFSRAGTLEYELGEDVVTVGVFEMSGPEAALGIFSHERDPDGAELGIGDAGSYSFGQFVFHRAAYYVKINYFGESDEVPVLKEFGAAVSERIHSASGGN